MAQMTAYEAITAAREALDRNDLGAVKDLLNKASAETSHLQTMLCEATWGHSWQDQEMDLICNLPWQKCILCGAARTQFTRPPLTLVKNE